MRTTLRLSLLFLGLLPCACGYRLQGRVVEGGFGTVSLVDAGDDRLQAQGVGGVRVQLVRDPQRLNREVIATCSTARDGSFTLETKTFAAGWTDERWEIIASRPGYGTAQAALELPANPDARRLLVEIDRGSGPRDGAPTAPVSGSLYDEAQKYDPTIGPRKGGNR
jgi:hypothetical protein